MLRRAVNAVSFAVVSFARARVTHLQEGPWTFLSLRKSFFASRPCCWHLWQWLRRSNRHHRQQACRNLAHRNRGPRKRSRKGSLPHPPPIPLRKRRSQTPPVTNLPQLRRIFPTPP